MTGTEQNITAHQGVAMTHFPINSEHGTVDYLFYVDGNAAEFAKSMGTDFTIQDATAIRQGIFQTSLRFSAHGQDSASQTR
jgi:hypothetical protein